ncbi:MAG: hypothetical protein QXQ91_01255 [Nanopusillaceae archaeon]
MLYIITLDIDDRKKFKKFLNFCKKNKIKNVFIRRSARNNFHVKIFCKYDKKFINFIRKKFDDKIRYKLDLEEVFKPKNVLFDLKVINGKTYIAKEFRKLSS